MRRALRNHGLGIFFGVIFLAALAGQAFAGWHQFNNNQVVDGLSAISLADYLTSASFAADVAENWQSEYLQFLLYIVATVWLVQIGSPESKTPEEAGQESDRDQKVGDYAGPDAPRWAVVPGFRRLVYSWSLALVMGLIFFLSWFAQSFAGWASNNETRLHNLQDPIAWSRYLVDPDFWSRTLQNWQSEFLAVGSMAVLSIYLRQRGSSQSKPVGTPHASTGVEG